MIAMKNIKNMNIDVKLMVRKLAKIPRMTINGIIIFIKNITKINKYVTGILYFSLIIIPIMILVIPAISHLVDDINNEDVWQIMKFNLPNKLIEEGYSGEVVRNRIIDHINVLREGPSVKPEGVYSYDLESMVLEEHFDFEIPEINSKYIDIINFIRKILKKDKHIIDGEALVFENTIELNIRIYNTETEKEYISRKFRSDYWGLDSLINEVAIYILRNMEPIIIAQYYVYEDTEKSLNIIMEQLKKGSLNHQLNCYSLWGMCLTAKEDYYGAIKKFEKVKEIDSCYTSSHMNIGYCYRQLGDLERALRTLKKGFAINKSKGICQNIALCYKEMGEIDSAIIYTNKCIENDNFNPEYYNLLGSIYKNKGDTTKAMDEFKKAIELDPTSTNSLYNLGTCEVYKGNFDSAEVYFRRVYELDSTDVEALRGIVTCLLSKSELKEAHNLLRKIIEIGDHELKAYAYYRLGHIEEMLGNARNAIYYYELVLKHDSKGKYGKSAMERLEKIKE